MSMFDVDSWDVQQITTELKRLRQVITIFAKASLEVQIEDLKKECKTGEFIEFNDKYDWLQKAAHALDQVDKNMSIELNEDEPKDWVNGRWGKIND